MKDQKEISVPRIWKTGKTDVLFGSIPPDFWQCKALIHNGFILYMILNVRSSRRLEAHLVLFLAKAALVPAVCSWMSLLELILNDARKKAVTFLWDDPLQSHSPVRQSPYRSEYPVNNTKSGRGTRGKFF